MDGVLPDGTCCSSRRGSRGQGFNAVLETTHRQNFLVPPRRPPLVPALRAPRASGERHRDAGAAVPATGWRNPGGCLAARSSLIRSCFATILGGAFAWIHRHDTICRDGQAPQSQRDYGIGQVQYLCHDGQIVTRP